MYGWVREAKAIAEDGSKSRGMTDMKYSKVKLLLGGTNSGDQVYHAQAPKGESRHNQTELSAWLNLARTSSFVSLPSLRDLGPYPTDAAHCSELNTGYRSGAFIWPSLVPRIQLPIRGTHVLEQNLNSVFNIELDSVTNILETNLLM